MGEDTPQNQDIGEPQDSWRDYIDNDIKGFVGEDDLAARSLDKLWENPDMREAIRALPALAQQRQIDDATLKGNDPPEATDEPLKVILRSGKGGSQFETDNGHSVISISPSQTLNFGYTDQNSGEYTPFSPVRVLGHEILHAADPAAMPSTLFEIQKQAASVVLEDPASVSGPSQATQITGGGHSDLYKLGTGDPLSKGLEELQQAHPEDFETARTFLDDLSAASSPEEFDAIMKNIQTNTGENFFVGFEIALGAVAQQIRVNTLEEPVVDQMDQVMKQLFGPDALQRTCYPNGLTPNSYGMGAHQIKILADKVDQPETVNPDAAPADSQPFFCPAPQTHQP